VLVFVLEAFNELVLAVMLFYALVPTNSFLREIELTKRSSLAS